MDEQMSAPRVDEGSGQLVRLLAPKFTRSVPFCRGWQRTEHFRQPHPPTGLTTIGAIRVRTPRLRRRMAVGPIQTLTVNNVNDFDGSSIDLASNPLKQTGRTRGLRRRRKR